MLPRFKLPAVISALFVFALVGAFGCLVTLRADEDFHKKKVVVYFMNETGLDHLILCVGGPHGAQAFLLDNDQPSGLPVLFVDDGANRVISVFQPGEKEAVCFFRMKAPGSFCVLITKGATEAKKKPGCSAPAPSVVTNTPI